MKVSVCTLQEAVHCRSFEGSDSILCGFHLRFPYSGWHQGHCHLLSSLFTFFTGLLELLFHGEESSTPLYSSSSSSPFLFSQFV